jgi:hypothetical protein
MTWLLRFNTSFVSNFSSECQLITGTLDQFNVDMVA